MALQPVMQTAATVACCTGELLPHLLTLIRLHCDPADGYFLLCYYTLTDICLSAVRHPLLPGLSSPQSIENHEAIEPAAAFDAKLRKMKLKKDKQFHLLYVQD